MKKRIIWLISFFSVIILSIVIMTTFINIKMVNSTKKDIYDINDVVDDNYDAILVLGCRVHGDNPSLMLSYRLEKAVEVYEKYHINIIISGSQEDNEIAVMLNYLLSSDVDPNMIYLDNKGDTTYDSIYRIKNVYKANKVIIITQEYHLYRSLYIADKLNLEAIGIKAYDIPYPIIMFKNNTREVLSRVKNYFKVMIKPESSKKEFEKYQEMKEY